VDELFVGEGVEEGGLADAGWGRRYAESPRITTLDRFRLCMLPDDLIDYLGNSDSPIKAGSSNKIRPILMMYASGSETNSDIVN
jgi:hypothetical protein